MSLDDVLYILTTRLANALQGFCGHRKAATTCTNTNGRRWVHDAESTRPHDDIQRVLFLSFIPLTSTPFRRLSPPPLYHHHYYYYYNHYHYSTTTTTTTTLQLQLPYIRRMVPQVYRIIVYLWAFMEQKKGRGRFGTDFLYCLCYICYCLIKHVRVFYLQAVSACVEWC